MLWVGRSSVVWCGKERFGRVRWYGGEVLMTKYWSSEWDGRDVCRDVRRDEGQEREADEHFQKLVLFNKARNLRSSPV